MICFYLAAWIHTERKSEGQFLRSKETFSRQWPRESRQCVQVSRHHTWWIVIIEPKNEVVSNNLSLFNLYCVCWVCCLYPWWRHQMEIFSALLAICAGKSPVTVEFPSQRAIDAELWYFLWSAHRINGWVNSREAGDLRRHRSLWRHCNGCHHSLSPSSFIRHHHHHHYHHHHHFFIQIQHEHVPKYGKHKVHLWINR